jgi:hypothetical protein
VYDRITGERGELSAIMQVEGLSPRALTAHMDLVQSCDLVFESATTARLPHR